MADITIKRGNLSPSIIMIARDAIGPADLEGVTAVFRMVNVLNGVAKVDDETATPAPGIAFTASGATLTAVDHPLNDGESVTLTTTGNLPGNLSTQKEYFVVNSTHDELSLALVQGGSPIVTANAGTGTHTLLSGRVTYDWQTGDTDTAGTYYGEIRTMLSGKLLSYPNTRQLLIEVISDLG